MVGLIKGLIELIKGMGITGKHLGKHAITLQYPEQKKEMFERSRGVVVLLSDKETGELNCTACELCMRACPTAAIRIDAPRDENKKKQLKSFVIDNSLCCYCGLCEEACNFSALKLATMYEYSDYDRDNLVWDVNKLQEQGRDVPYEDKRKKKPVKKVVKKDPPAEAQPAAEKPKTEEVKKEEPKADTETAPKTDAAPEKKEETVENKNEEVKKENKPEEGESK